MAQKRCLLLHVNNDQAKELTRELFVRGWDVVDSDNLSEHELDVDVAVLVWPSSTAMVKAYQHGFDKFLAKRDGLMLVVPDPAGEPIDLTECTLTNASLVHVDTISELATKINGYPPHVAVEDASAAIAPCAVPPREAIHRLEDIFNGMKRTARERHDVYGDSFLTFGRVATALWPAGLSVGTEEEFARLGVLVQIISKLCRYSVSPQGHADSAHDMAVYSAILELLTEDLAVPPEALP